MNFRQPGQLILTLELDFIDWNIPKRFHEDHFPQTAVINFATYTLPKGPNGCLIRLSSLQKLNLSGVDLEVTHDLLTALNLSHLLALTLHRCHNVPALLQ